MTHLVIIERVILTARDVSETYTMISVRLLYSGLSVEHMRETDTLCSYRDGSHDIPTLKCAYS